MANVPYFKIYPGDELKNFALLRCSRAARSVWMDLRCLMSQGDEIGRLVQGAKVLSVQDAAAMLTGDTAANVVLIQELLANGVATRDKRGAITAQSMVEEETLSGKRRKAGSIGGKQSCLSKIQANTQAKCDSEYDIDVDVVEKGDSKGGKTKNPSANLSELQRKCLEIYDAYPKKVAKSDAIRAIVRALDRVEFAVLLKKVQEYAAASAGHPDDGTVIPGLKYPATWFNKDCWEDDPAEWSRWRNTAVSGVEERRRIESQRRDEQREAHDVARALEIQRRANV